MPTVLQEEDMPTSKVRTFLVGEGEDQVGMRMFCCSTWLGVEDANTYVNKGRATPTHVTRFVPSNNAFQLVQVGAAVGKARTSVHSIFENFY